MTEKKPNPIFNAGAAMMTAAAGMAKKAAATGADARRNSDILYAERVRQLFKKNDDIRDDGLTAPGDVIRITDLSYGPDPMQVLDIYYPEGADRALPTIVSVHGGGFVYGDKERYQFYCMSLAQRGFAVVNFSYRLAPEHRFPAQLEDTNLVMRFIVDFAKRNMALQDLVHEGSTQQDIVPIGSAGSSGSRIIDLDNLFMVGDSAGAMLAGQYCAALSNPAYAGTLEMEVPPLAIRACALNCGLYEFDPKKDRMMARCYLNGPAGDYAKKMDLCGNITREFPPAFIMTSTGDFLKGRAEPFAALLSRQGVEYELHVYGDRQNRPGHVFHCNMRDPLAARCNDDECAFFLRHMK